MWNPNLRKQHTAISPVTCANCRKKVKIGQTYFWASDGEGKVICLECQELSLKIYERHQKDEEKS